MEVANTKAYYNIATIPVMNVFILQALGVNPKANCTEITMAMSLLA